MLRRLCLLLLLSLTVFVQGDLFHYYHLKKFLTAVAFARALGRRPTILPVPIPIPIPIAQNEVIKLPAKSAKSFLSLGGGGHKYSGGGFSKNDFTGSSSFGYALPGQFDSGGFGGGGESNIVVLDGGGGNGLDALGGADFASSNVIRMISGRPRGFFGGKPRRIIFAPGNTMRTSENMAWPARQIPPVIHYVPKRSKSSAKKKPIPVGEKFRLP